MRSLWKGSISFGLVNVPIKVYSATESHDVSLHMVHEKDGGRIRFQRRCEECGEVVEYADIARAYTDAGATIVLTSDDLDSLPVEQNHEIGVVEFVPAEQVDVLRLDKSYYVEPEKSGLKAYTLLRQALEDTDRLAIVQFTLRQKSRMGVLRAHGDVLVVQTMLWADEVRDASFPILDESVKISDQEMQMANQLVDSLSSDFSEDAFSDDYQEQLKKLIEAKLDDGEAFTVEEDASDDDGEVIDLMEALQRSLGGGAKQASGSGAKGSTAKKAGSGGAKKAPAKKTAAKKSAAKTSTAKKPAAKKASGSSSAKKSTTRKTSARKSA